MIDVTPPSKHLKNCCLYLLLFYSIVGFTQIGNYNQYPTLTPQRPIDLTSNYLLDTHLNKISFAYSFRKLKSDYTGPLVRLRRGNDNEERNFYVQDTDALIDINAINNWLQGNNAFMVIWYDQSGQERNAIQNTKIYQPRFIPNVIRPYFVGDGNNDYLVVETSMQVLTKNGREGSVFISCFATNKSQSIFGAKSNSNNKDRWSAHLNWNNGNAYWDPGYCCLSGRNFNNNANIHLWKLYTFIRKTATAQARVNGTIKTNFNFSPSYRFTKNTYFGILRALNNGSDGHANNRINEMILYNDKLGNATTANIENNIIAYWNL